MRAERAGLSHSGRYHVGTCVAQCHSCTRPRSPRQQRLMPIAEADGKGSADTSRGASTSSTRRLAPLEAASPRGVEGIAGSGYNPLMRLRKSH